MNDRLSIIHSPNAVVPETNQATLFKSRSGRTVGDPSGLIEKGKDAT